jgi:hypothetical protein
VTADQNAPYGSGANPFLGLRPFTEEDTDVFFGRGGQVSRLLRRLDETRFLAIVGSSGCGKSSLVLAGLVPELRHGRIEHAGKQWRIASMRPGGAPIAALARALSGALPSETGEDAPALDRPEIQYALNRGELGLVDVVYQARLPEDENLLIVVDQFEELFNYAYAGSGEGAASAGDCAAFVKLLIAASERADLPIYVAITMRSDFIGDCARVRDLPEVINSGLFLVPRLTRDELRRAIEEPVLVRGATMTPRLVSRVLNDIGSDSDQLPVLQHALMRTWTEWERTSPRGSPIDVPHYTAIGEMSAALENHAEDIYGRLDERSQLVAERLYRCLTARDSENRGKRRPTAFRVALDVVDATRAELEALILTYNAVDVSFLRPTGPPPYDDMVIDISHESLMRLWNRLAEWVEKEATSGQLYARLVEDATVPRPLWINPDVAVAEAWFVSNRNIINPAWAARYDRGLEGASARGR